MPGLRGAVAVAAVLILLATPAAGSARTAGDRAEGRMIKAINVVRAQHGLHTLTTSRSLMASAGRFSRWLMEHNVFGHLSSIRASSRFDVLGEALAMHWDRRFRVRSTLSRWMASPPHRAIVLSPTVGRIGTGVTRGRMASSRATVWVLHVGRLRPATPTLPSLPRLPG